MTAPSLAHEARREALDAVALLAGYALDLSDGLPDGRRPDVVRLRPRPRSLFIGEAKETEAPGGIQTQVRLLAYMRWFAAEVSRPGGSGVFALCFDRSGDHDRWETTLRALAHEAGFRARDVGHLELAARCHCAWINSVGDILATNGGRARGTRIERGKNLTHQDVPTGGARLVPARRR